MAQNTSSAVMQQRREPPNSLDSFPTPPFATRALCNWLLDQGQELPTMAVREPAAGQGHMVKVLREYFLTVEAADVFDYGVGFPALDYLFGLVPEMTDFTITNPPFRLAEAFIDRALATSRHGAAMLVRTSFLESETRFKTLFSKMPPTDILQFTERVVMLRGRLVRAGEDDPDNLDDDGKPRKASTATSYAWLVWQAERIGMHTRFHWIAPCRRRLEREHDYDALGVV